MSPFAPRALLALAICLGSSIAQSSGPFDVSTFPQCSKDCYTTLSGLPGVCDITQSDCSCAVFIRSYTATCETVNCSPSDFDETETLSEQGCEPLYNSDPALSASVSSAVSTATSLLAAQATLDPTDQSSYPLCAQQCQTQGLAASGCGSLANRECVCGPAFGDSTDPCQGANCTPEELSEIFALGFVLCQPVGGVRYDSPSDNSSTSTEPSTSTRSSPSNGSHGTATASRSYGTATASGSHSTLTASGSHGTVPTARPTGTVPGSGSNGVGPGSESNGGGSAPGPNQSPISFTGEATGLRTSLYVLSTAAAAAVMFCLVLA